MCGDHLDNNHQGRSLGYGLVVNISRIGHDLR